MTVAANIPVPYVKIRGNKEIQKSMWISCFAEKGKCAYHFIVTGLWFVQSVTATCTEAEVSITSVQILYKWKLWSATTDFLESYSALHIKMTGNSD